VEQLIGPVDDRKEVVDNWENDEGLQVAVINYESTWRMEDSLDQWNADEIILDESQKIKNGTAKQSKACHNLGEEIKYKMISQGTPVTEDPLDFHSQYQFLDPEIFPQSFTKFRDKYAIMGGYGGYEVKGYRNLEELASKAHSIAYRITKDEALDLPETVDQNLYCNLSDTCREYYNQMKKNSLLL